jgi:Arabinose efflux permease
MLPVVLLAMFMAGFDIWVVNVAGPSLQRDLHVSDAALQLIVGGYAFMYASGMVTGGRLGDLAGYRRMFMIGVAGFAVASLLCGLARSPAELVGARLLQGLTGAVMVPQVLALITATFPAPERSRALAWFGVTMGLAFVPARSSAACCCRRRAGPGLARDLPGERAGGRGHADRRGARGAARARHRRPPA